MKIEQRSGAIEPVSLREFIERADRVYRPEEPATAWELRYALLGLAQDKEAIWTLILEALTRRLGEPLPSEQASYYVLYDCANYSIRATVWLPEKVSSEVGILENAVFAYDYPHNHNFDLLTVNVFGPGYETDLYGIELLGSGVAKGTAVAAENLGRHRLAPGTMLFYEAFGDVHLQIPTTEISVALNFMPRSPYYRTRPQYAFEVLGEKELRVSGWPLCEEARELWAMRLMAKLSQCGVDVADCLHAVRDKAPGYKVGQLAGEMIRLAERPEQFAEFMLREQSGGATVNYRQTARFVRAQRLAAG